MLVDMCVLVVCGWWYTGVMCMFVQLNSVFYAYKYNMSRYTWICCRKHTHSHHTAYLKVKANETTWPQRIEWGYIGGFCWANFDGCLYLLCIMLCEHYAQHYFTLSIHYCTVQYLVWCVVRCRRLHFSDFGLQEIKYEINLVQIVLVYQVENRKLSCPPRRDLCLCFNYKSIRIYVQTYENLIYICVFNSKWIFRLYNLNVKTLHFISCSFLPPLPPFWIVITFVINNFTRKRVLHTRCGSKGHQIDCSL